MLTSGSDSELAEESDDDDGPEDDALDNLVTCYPAKPSTFGETDDIADTTKDENDENYADDDNKSLSTSDKDYQDAIGSGDDRKTPTVPVLARLHGLCRLSRMHYTSSAIFEAI